MQVPVRICNLRFHALADSVFYSQHRGCLAKSVQQGEELTASGLIFPSGASTFHSLVLGISMIPSMIAWVTCTPLGPNSLDKLCVSERNANFPVEKADVIAEPFIAAVAPVKMSVGGYLRSVDLRRRGSVAWAKWKAPRLLSISSISV